MSERQQRQHNPFNNQGDKPGDNRQPFQVDRDRILYSSAFRRLAQITQVLTAQEGHVFHNRLTHSLKVAQVARRLAEKLVAEQPKVARAIGGINPDVVEAGALAHDLGHPPFGHTAEQELDTCAKKAGLVDGFEGNAQSFRILTRLAIHRIDYYGLNLTKATLNAVLKYPWMRSPDRKSKRHRKFCIYELDFAAFEFVRSPTDDLQSVEASIMDFADDITYSVHDLEDFYLAGLIPLELLATDTDELDRFIAEWIRVAPHNRVAQVVKDNPQRFQKFLDATYNLKGLYSQGSFEQKAQIKRISSQLIQNYLQSVELSDKYGDRGYLKYNLQREEELKFLQRIVWTYVISSPRMATQRYGQKRIIKTLFEIYLQALGDRDLSFIPPRFVKEFLDIEAKSDSDRMDKEHIRMAVDIVAGLSEAEAVVQYRRLTGISQGLFMDSWG